MSWHSELAPPTLTPSNLARDLIDAWGQYTRAGLTFRERVMFVVLRATQRVAYGFGWSAGRRARQNQRDVTTFFRV